MRNLNYHDIEDIEAEARLRVVKAGKSVRGQGYYQVAVRHARVDYVRRHGYARTIPVAEMPDRATEDPSGYLVLRLALDALPERHRQVLLVYADCGCKCEDAAAVMGIPPRTFSCRLRRARAAARQLFAGEGDAGTAVG